MHFTQNLYALNVFRMSTCMRAPSRESHARPVSEPRDDCLKGSAIEGGMRHSASAGVGAVSMGWASSSKSPGQSCQLLPAPQL